MERIIRTQAPPLLPLFRSDGQGRLLARIYLAPDRPESLAGIAREIGLDPGGVAREADRLEAAGLIRSERIGGVRVLSPDVDSPFHPGLYDLLLKAFGPATLIGPALAEVPGVEDAYIFGSWAARYLGEAGPPPADVDVLIVGRPGRRGVRDALAPIEARLHRDVNETIVSRSRWDDPTEGFIIDVRGRPLLRLDLPSGRAGG